MHWEQTQFILAVKSALPEMFRGGSVLEVGSYDVNGSIRPLFETTSYLGIDLIPGPGVDLVCSGHEFQSTERFDVAISTECFEHNPHWAETFLTMTGHVKPGGMVLFTCASEGRPEHGTSRADPASSPGSVSRNPDYYRNLVAADFDHLDLKNLFSEHLFTQNRASNDLYFVGLTRRAGQLEMVAKRCDQIERLSDDMAAAAALAKAGDAEQALVRLAEAYETAPPSAKDQLLARRGWLLANCGRKTEAELVVRQALAMSDDANLHWQLATILHAQGNPHEAAGHARRAVELAPANARFTWFLGAMYQAMGRLDDAEAALQASLKLDPTLAEAHHQLSMVRIKQGQFTKATDEARKAVGLHPGSDMFKTHLEALLRRS